MKNESLKLSESISQMQELGRVSASRGSPQSNPRSTQTEILVSLSEPHSYFFVEVSDKRMPDKFVIT